MALPEKKREELYVEKSTTLLLAIEKKKGLAAQACRDLKIPYPIYLEWYRTKEEFKAQVDEIRGPVIDEVEEALLHNAVEKKNQRAIEYYLDAQAKERGYGKQEANGSETNTTIQIIQIGDTKIEF